MTENSNSAQEAIRLKEQIGQVKTKDGMKPYVGKESALILFRRDYPVPVGRINTVMIQAEPPIFKAEIYINEVMVASAHASPEGNTTTFRKVEGAAIRRALEIAGYGAKSIIDRIVESIGVDEAKKLLGSGGGERRLGGQPEQKKSEPPAPRPPVTTPPGKVEELPWTKKEQEQFYREWVSTENGMTQGDIFAALKIKALGDWKKSHKSADDAMQAYVDEVVAGLPAEPKSNGNGGDSH